jgi:hypothetical protein
MPTTCCFDPLCSGAGARNRLYDALIDTFTQTLSDPRGHSLTLLRHEVQLVWHSVTLADTP